VSADGKLNSFFMGLRSAKHGVKAELKLRYPQAFREFDSLVDARDASMAKREETFACIDGNVLMMSVPQNARTLDAYVAIVTSILKRAIATCYVTVVVFDNPYCITEAKRQEQMKRDASKASTAVVCSSDIASVSPKDDSYEKQYIVDSEDVHSLVNNRATRNRFFDEVAMQVLSNLTAQVKRWNDSGFGGGHILFDGIDPRGGDRPLGEARAPEMVGSCERLRDLFQRSIDIGEGDLKLADLGRRVRSLSQGDDPSFKNTKLSLCTTIDTDSFAIELLEEAKRCKDDESKKPFNTLLCMRERASNKRGMDEDEQRKAYYLCCDVTLLHALLQRSMWGVSRSPSTSDRHAAMTLMCAGWALCGCDFVEVKGMRSDVVFDCISTVVKTIPSAVENTKHAWSGKRECVERLHQPIRALAIACASRLLDIPRIKKDFVPSVRDLDDLVVRRTAWLLCYWNSCEFKGGMEEFGFVMPFDSMPDFK
jgi:hypothetical protein